MGTVNHIVNDSFYLEEIATKCNISNTMSVKKRIQSLNLNISHFKFNHPKSNLFNLQSFSQKRKRIINEKLIPYICNKCKISKWNEKDIALQLDHIDGNRENNCFENYRFLCPNCHSQTETHSRNKKYYKYAIVHVNTKDQIQFETFKDICEYLSTSETKIRRWFKRKDIYKDYTISLI